jgi:hypothetical protein
VSITVGTDSLAWARQGEPKTPVNSVRVIQRRTIATSMLKTKGKSDSMD